MKKANCLEFTKCEKEAGGANISELEISPVSTTSKTMDGFCNGENGGSSCTYLSRFLILNVIMEEDHH